MGKLLDTTPEENRVEALRRCFILDTPPESAYDRINTLAASLIGVPVAMITFVDHSRIWIKSRVGVELEQIDRDAGLCSRVILSESPYVVEDAASDPRTATHPLVTGDFGLRFYAGFPLTTSEGFSVGTLCVVDKAPRRATRDEIEILRCLAGLVTELLERSIENRRLRREIEEHGVRAGVTDRLLADAAHDLRNPLNAVILNGNLLAEQKVGTLNPMQARMVESMCESGGAMLRTMTDYVTYASLAHESAPLFRRLSSFGEIVTDCVAEQSLMARAKGIHVSFQSKHQDIELELDGHRIREAVGLVIGHAMERPNTAAVRVSLDASQKWVRLYVRSECAGAVGEMVTKETADSPVTRVSGMPLRIAERIVAAHDGQMGVSGIRGKEFLARIELPIPKFHQDLTSSEYGET